MTAFPLRCVIDTNVAVTANGANDGAPATCVASSAKALALVMSKGHVFVDAGGRSRIVDEYRKHLRAAGEPGPGDAFLKWILTNEWSGQRVTRVVITPKSVDGDDFHELPPPPENTVYDPSDRMFLAVAAAHPERPSILQSFDSKWWGWRAALGEIGVAIHFLCEEAIEAKYNEKMAP